MKGLHASRVAPRPPRFPPWHGSRTEGATCRESVVLLRLMLILGMLGFCASGALAQAPPPGQSERELQQPLSLDDGKPTPAQAPASEPSGWRALGSLVLVLGLAGGGLYAFKRWGARHLPGSGGSRLKVEETLALGERRFVSILKADDEKFLIGLSPQGIHLLARLDGVEAAPPDSFGQALESQVQVNRPMPVREVEALMQQEGRR